MAFVMRAPSPVVREKVAAVGAGLHDLPLELGMSEDLDRLRELVEETGAAGVILDGYQFNEDYLHGLGQAACCLFFDELARFYFNNALVLNQNVHAEDLTYHRASHTKLLLGPRYAVLRPQFMAAKRARRDHPPKAERLLVSFGGSDPYDLTSRAIQGLALSKERYRIKVVLGGENQHAKQVRALSKDSPHQIEVLRDVSDMAAVMNWADLALSASGTNTTLEMSCLGLPMVLVIQAENQRLIGEAMGRKGLAEQLGFWSEVSGAMMCEAVDALANDPGWRARMSQLLMATVDGRGAERVARALLETCGEGRP